MDAQTRAAALRFWERQVRAHGDSVRVAVLGDEGGVEALKTALIEQAARRIARVASRARVR